MHIEKVGVIGAGQMGSGIAQVCALSGIAVLINDLSEARTRASIDGIRSSLGKLVERRQMESHAVGAAVERIAPALDLAALGDCDLVIEATTENEEVKRRIFGAVCPHLRADTLLASNTSSISITRLAAASDRPERFIGIHFMNPAIKMQLVELIRGIATEDATFESAKAFITRLGKTATLSEDFPAFIVNRILLPMINEAIYTLYEGVGSLEAIDTAMKLGANHPMGAASMTTAAARPSPRGKTPGRRAPLPGGAGQRQA